MNTGHKTCSKFRIVWFIHLLQITGMSTSLQSSNTWDVADASQNPAESSPEVEKAAKSPEGSEVSSEFFTE